MWAVIVSIVWKVVGFGMILFVAAIQAIPREINEAAMVDGASYWQRVRRITLPLTARTILLVTLVSVIGSLLAFDQFYIMTAGQPRNLTATSVFLIYLNSFPYLKLGYGAALSLILAAIILVCTVLQMVLTPQEPRMSAADDGAWRACSTAARSRPSLVARLLEGRTKYLVGARLHRALHRHAAAAASPRCWPRSRSTDEAAAVPPTYFPHGAQPRQLRAAVELPGRPADLSRSTAAAPRSSPSCSASALTIPAGYALARFPMPGKEVLFVVLLLGLIIPYQALLTPLFFMFVQAQAAQLAGRPRHHPHRDPAAVQHLHHAQRLRGGAARAGGGGGDRRLQQLAGAGARLPAGDRAGDHHGRAVRLHHLVERAPRPRWSS